MGFGKEKQINL